MSVPKGFSKMSMYDSSIDLLVKYEIIIETKPSQFSAHPSFEKTYKLLRDMKEKPNGDYSMDDKFNFVTIVGGGLPYIGSKLGDIAIVVAFHLATINTWAIRTSLPPIDPTYEEFEEIVVALADVQKKLSTK